MRIGGIGTLPTLAPPAATPSAAASRTADVGGGAKPSFADAINDAVSQVNDSQKNADQLTQKLATGDVEDLHKVMLALNQANSAFGLTVQVRNKAIEAYQDVMRMQV